MKISFDCFLHGQSWLLKLDWGKLNVLKVRYVALYLGPVVLAVSTPINE